MDFKFVAQIYCNLTMPGACKYANIAGVLRRFLSDKEILTPGKSSFGLSALSF